MKPEEALFWQQIYELRILIFAEVEPQSNKYHQVMITKENLRPILQSMVIGQPHQASGGRMFADLDVSKETYILPDLKTLK